MNWEAIGATGEIAGALAVVVSLLYVAGQIRQNNRQSASDTGFAIVAESNRLLEWVAAPEIANVLVKLGSEMALTPQEEIVAEAFSERVLNGWWVSETSHKNGIIDEDMYQTMREEVNRYIKTYPRMRRYLRQLLSHYPEASKMSIFVPIFENE